MFLRNTIISYLCQFTECICYHIILYLCQFTECICYHITEQKYTVQKLIDNNNNNQNKKAFYISRKYFRRLSFMHNVVFGRLLIYSQNLILIYIGLMFLSKKTNLIYVFSRYDNIIFMLYSLRSIVLGARTNL